MKDDTSTPTTEGDSPNAFERDKPGTSDRSRAEAAIEGLRQRGGVFVNAVRATRMPMILTDPNLPGNPIVFANEAFIKLSGYGMDDVLGQQPHFMNGRMTDQKDAARFAEALRSDQDDIIETVQYRKDGSRFVATVLLSAFKGDDGHVLNHFMSWLDVTRRVDAEDEAAALRKVQADLQESERKYRTLFNSIDEGFCVVEVLFDEDGQPVDYVFLEANSAFERQTGLSNAIGKRIRDLAPDHEQQWFDIYGRIATTGEAQRFEQKAEALGRWYDVYAFRIGDERQRQVAILFNDIAERKRADEALRESENRLRDILNSMHEGFAKFDPGFTIVDVNEETLRLDGRSRDELIGQSHWDAFPNTEHSELGALYRQVMRDRKPASLEHLYVWPDGRDMWVDARMFPTTDGGLAVFWRDITDSKRSELALRASERHAQTLLAELQHRVRNTLAVVRSIARRTADRSIDLDEMVSHFEGRLNAFSRVQSAVTRSPDTGVELGAMIEDELLAVATREGEQLTIDGPDLHLRSRAAESISLAIHELATNAVKYGALSAPKGKVRVTWARKRNGGADELVLEWLERGLPERPEAKREGFGHEMLLRSLPYDLGAKTDITFTEDGLRFTLSLPLAPDVIAEEA